ncbi:hypothetical protein B0H10DRAFT_1991185 [Mycena sp. CBHHK59/15]|nr:hypothetical protein B0H10DRAFT_1991185 [Mycena sp. CBHHK59/15]
MRPRPGDRYSARCPSPWGRGVPRAHPSVRHRAHCQDAHTLFLRQRSMLPCEMPPVPRPSPSAQYAHRPTRCSPATLAATCRRRPSSAEAPSQGSARPSCKRTLDLPGGAHLAAHRPELHGPRRRPVR